MGWSMSAVLLKVSGLVFGYVVCVCVWGRGEGGRYGVEYVCCPAESEWVWCLVTLFVCVWGGGGGKGEEGGRYGVEYVCCPAESEWFGVWLRRLCVCVLGRGGGGREVWGGVRLLSC